MAWTVEFTEEAEKLFGKLPKQAQQQIRDYLRKKVLTLDDPKLLGKPLRHNKSGLWRYRVQKYRIICTFEDDRLVVVVLTIGKRDKVYK